MFARSEPVPGSVMQMPRRHSPRIAGGSQRCFCASLPYARTYGMQIDECTAVMRPCARRRAISSITIASYRKSPPPPPYSTGMAGPRNPSSPRRRQVARSVVRFRFHSATFGSISRSAKRRSWARKISCSSLKISRRTGHFRQCGG